MVLVVVFVVAVLVCATYIVSTVVVASWASYVCVCVGVRIRSVRRRVSRRHRITCRVNIMLVHNTRTVVVFMFVFLFVGFILTRVVPVLHILVCVLVVIGMVVIGVLILVALH